MKKNLQFLLVIFLAYTLGSSPLSASAQTSDYGVYKWNGTEWDNVPGVEGIRIAMDENGNPWVVNSNHEIYRFVNNTFVKLPGTATDIGIGGGSVWIIGTDPVGTDSDYGIYKWNGSDWDNISGGGVRIAVDENGNPWVTNSVKDIYQFQVVSDTWIQLPGTANDIGIGGGSVWIIGTNPVGTGADFGIYKWNGSDWDNIPGGGVNIAVDENGHPWITNSVKDIYHFPNYWIKLPGQANDIGIGGGEVCVIGNVAQTSDYGIYEWNGSVWENIPGGAGIRIAMDENGNPWVVNSNHDIYQFVNHTFVKLPGKATDIGIGGGSVWIIGTNPVGTDSDYGIYKWNGSDWDNISGGGVRIAVDENGNPWITNSVKDIYHFQVVSDTWIQLPGTANDIGIGGGSVWIIGTNPVGTDADFGIYKWNGSDWDNISGGGVNIAVDENGYPWITNSVKDIYHFPNYWIKLPGQANDIGIGGGKVCIIGNVPVEYGIKNFSLINTATKEVISNFDDSVTVDIARSDFSNIVVRANTNPAKVGSVSFMVDGVNKNYDNNEPYELKKSAFQSLSTGSHWLYANAFTKRNGNGVQGMGKGAVINIVNSSTVTHFDIVNTSGVVLKELHDNDVINIGNAAFKKITIVAHVNNSKVRSVVFDLNDFHHIENIAPYALNGDHDGYYKPWPFSVGEYLLLGTPYSKPKGKGNAGKMNSLTFWVINTDTLSAIANSRIAEQESSLAKSNGLSLYPVPTRDEINVMPGSEKIVEVRIISTTGQVHFKSDRLDGSKLITISTSKIGLVSGIYFLQAINDKGRIVVKKLIKE